MVLFNLLRDFSLLSLSLWEFFDLHLPNSLLNKTIGVISQKLII